MLNDIEKVSDLVTGFRQVIQDIWDGSFPSFPL